MKKAIIIALLFILASCESDEKTKGIFLEFSVTPSAPLGPGEHILADGTSTLEVRLVLNKDAGPDRRSVVLKTSSGIFLDNNSKTFTAKATYLNGELVAMAKIRVSSKPGQMTITAQPEFDSPLNEYIFTQFVEVHPSIPQSITVTTSSFGLGGNYLNEVKITGILKNQKGAGVSEGYKVDFQDLLLPVETAAGGQFREKQDTTKDSSKVSAFYSSPLSLVGTQIKIRLIILSPDGSFTDKLDSKTVTINQ